MRGRAPARVRNRVPRRLRPRPPTRRVQGLLFAGAGALGLALGAAAGPHALAALERPLLLERVAVRGHRHLAPAELARTARLAPGMRIDAAALGEARRRLEAHPRIASARAALLPPSRVLLAVEERVPLARAALEGGDAYVDAAGVPFGRAAGDGALPRLVGVASAERGRAHPRLAQGAALLLAAQEEGLPVPARVALGGAAAAALPSLVLPDDGPRVLLGAAATRAKLARLAILWRQEAALLRGAAEIDLRFGDQVVLRSEAASGGSGESEARSGAASG